MQDVDTKKFLCPLNLFNLPVDLILYTHPCDPKQSG